MERRVLGRGRGREVSDIGRGGEGKGGRGVEDHVQVFP